MDSLCSMRVNVRDFIADPKERQQHDHHVERFKRDGVFTTKEEGDAPMAFCFMIFELRLNRPFPAFACSLRGAWTCKTTRWLAGNVAHSGPRGLSMNFVPSSSRSLSYCQIALQYAAENATHHAHPKLIHFVVLIPPSSKTVPLEEQSLLCCLPQRRANPCARAVCLFVDVLLVIGAGKHCLPLTGSRNPSAPPSPLPLLLHLLFLFFRMLTHRGDSEYNLKKEAFMLRGTYPSNVLRTITLAEVFDKLLFCHCICNALSLAIFQGSSAALSPSFPLCLQSYKDCLSMQHPFACVLALDVVNFTRFSSQSKPEELISIMSDLFDTFDCIAERHGVQRVKIIGAYITTVFSRF